RNANPFPSQTRELETRTDRSAALATPIDRTAARPTPRWPSPISTFGRQATAAHARRVVEDQRCRIASYSHCMKSYEGIILKFAKSPPDVFPTQKPTHPLLRLLNWPTV